MDVFLVGKESILTLVYCRTPSRNLSSGCCDLVLYLTSADANMEDLGSSLPIGVIKKKDKVDKEKE